MDLLPFLQPDPWLALLDFYLRVILPSLVS